jgi:HEAT repeats/PBS lyase HEAT-like repeat
MIDENQEKLPIETDGETEKKQKGILIIFRFILVPLILVGVVIFLIILFGQMALKEKSVRDYLYDIRTGSQSERWQAAYHLSNLLANPKKDYVTETKKELPEMMLIFKKAEGKDPEIRRYLVLAMGRLKDPRAIPALEEGMYDEDSQTALWSIWALGNIGDQSVTSVILEKLESQDPAIRIMSAYVLGALADPKAIPALQAHLEDSSEEVQWNSALALARLHNDTGSGLLLKMMSRDYLSGFSSLGEPKKEELMVNTIHASQKLKNDALLDQIKILSTTDPNPRVRDAAIKALQ